MSFYQSRPAHFGYYAQALRAGMDDDEARRYAETAVRSDIAAVESQTRMRASMAAARALMDLGADVRFLGERGEFVTDTGMPQGPTPRWRVGQRMPAFIADRRLAAQIACERDLFAFDPDRTTRRETPQEN